MEKDNIKTIRDFIIPQFTLLASPEQDEIIRQREQEAEREHEKELQEKKEVGVRTQRSSEAVLE